MGKGGYEEWALDEMDKLGMNEIKYCNYKGYNIIEILKEEEPDEEDEENEF